LAAVADLPRVAVSHAEVIEIRHGRPIKRLWPEIPAAEAAPPAEGELADEWVALDSEARLVAILRQKNPGELWPGINFDCEDETDPI
jgi:hypothetical protein